MLDTAITTLVANSDRIATALEGILAKLNSTTVIGATATTINPDTQVGGKDHRETVAVEEPVKLTAAQKKAAAAETAREQEELDNAAQAVRDAANKAAAAEAAVEEPDPLDAKPAGKAITEDEVRVALKNYRDIEGSAAMMEILTKHGKAASMAELKEENYAAVLAAVK